MIKPTESSTETAHDHLLRENEHLKRKLAELQAQVSTPNHEGAAPGPLWRPSRVTIWSLVMIVAVLIALAFLTGFIPLAKRNATLRGEAADQVQSLPRVEVITVARATAKSELELPGNIQAVTEAPILARAEGYVRRRYVDLGDRVHAGQAVAEIEAPELDQQVLQAQANLEQAKAALEQAQASYQQGKSNMEMAKLTAQRWTALGAKGVVSRQDNDQYQSQYQAQLANVQALDKAISAQRSNITAAEANLSRLRNMQDYRVVRAPFDGVITQRNIDVGALVNSGNTLLYRIAQTATLRTYANVPQSHASSIHVGQTALLTVSNLPGRVFSGTVARTANSLDPATRTLLVEIHVPNADGALLPGMYCQVQLNSPRAHPPLAIPTDALVIRTGAPMAAVLRADHTIHLQPLVVGRDFGDRIEVLSGLEEGDTIIPHPGDVAEGLKVEPVSPAH